MLVEKVLKIGFSLVDSGEFEECITHVNKAIKDFENDPDLHALRAEAFFKLNKYEEALKDFNKAARIEPLNPYRYSSRAFLKDAMGDTRGAVDDYKKAYELDPNDATILNNMGVLEEKLGYKEAAKKRFDLADTLYQLDQENLIIEEDSASNSLEKPKDENYFQILNKIFSNKAYRKEYIQFLKNGFKLK